MTETLVPKQPLIAYLHRQPGFQDVGPGIEISRIAGGQSNLTFILDLGERRVVLRRPPPGPLPPSAHDVLREYRVLEGMVRSSVPVPRPLLGCVDTSIIGAPFYIAEYVPGVTIRYELPDGFANAPISERRALADRFIDTLVDLHRTDPAAVGLSDLGRPAGYLTRQFRRWSQQLPQTRVRATPDIDWLTEWVAAHFPADADERPVSIVHGDYRLDNLLFAPAPPARVLAVVDWEMSTLGDPLADLGYVLASWQQPGDSPPEIHVFSRLTELPGFPTRAELAERYAERSGRPIEDLKFYVVFALWKMSIFFEAHWARHVNGTAGAFDFSALEHENVAYAARIRRLAQENE